MTAYEDKEVYLNGVNYMCEVEISGRLVDESFDHEFGTHDPGCSIEIEGIEIITVWNEEEETVITSRRIISQLENLIDAADFDNVEF